MFPWSQKGADVLAAWRTKNPGIRLDLRQADLPSNLSGSKLEDAYRYGGHDPAHRQGARVCDPAAGPMACDGRERGNGEEEENQRDWNRQIHVSFPQRGGLEDHDHFQPCSGRR
jgi:hypothetical protein